MARECPFCRIAQEEAPARFVLRESGCVAFLDHRPLAPGHVLLAPRSHILDLVELPDDLLTPFFRTARLLAHAIEVGLGAEGTFLAINVKISQSVPHLHMHIVPRTRTDRLFSQKLLWKRSPYPDEETAAAVQERIRRAVDEIRRGVH
jgi:histidine triad (HIT) family protein